MKKKKNNKTAGFSSACFETVVLQLMTHAGAGQ
jgi:hypothetical protein